MINPISPILILILVLSSFILSSCDKKVQESPEEKRKRIEKTVDKKLNDRRRERMKICKENAIKIAGQKVDSILIAQAKLTSVDTVGKPLKPIKPDLPEFVPPKDSTEIEPLFEEVPDTIK